MLISIIALGLCLSQQNGTGMYPVLSHFGNGINPLTLEFRNSSIINLTMTKPTNYSNLGLVPDYISYQKLNISWNKSRVFNWSNPLKQESSHTSPGNYANSQNLLGVFSQDYLWQKNQFQNPNVSVIRWTMNYLVGQFDLDYFKVNLTDSYLTQLQTLNYNLEKNTSISNNMALQRALDLIDRGSLIPYTFKTGNRVFLDIAIDVVNTNMTLDEMVDTAKLCFDNLVFKSNHSIPDDWLHNVKGNQTNYKQSNYTYQNYSDWLNKTTNQTSEIVVYETTDSQLMVGYLNLSQNLSKIMDVMRYINYAERHHVDTNTFLGCMNPSSSNYNVMYNKHDNTMCSDGRTTYHFNGFFQKGHGVLNGSVNPNYQCDVTNDNSANYTTSYWWGGITIPCGENCNQVKLVPDYVKYRDITSVICQDNQSDVYSVSSFRGMSTNYQYNEYFGELECPSEAKSHRMCLNYNCQYYYTICHWNEFSTIPYFGGLYSSMKFIEADSPATCPSGYVRFPVLIPGTIDMMYYCFTNNTNIGHRNATYLLQNYTDSYDVYQINDIYGLEVDPNSPLSYAEQYRQLFPITTTATPHHKHHNKLSGGAIFGITLLIFVITNMVVYLICKVKKHRNTYSYEPIY